MDYITQEYMLGVGRARAKKGRNSQAEKREKRGNKCEEAGVDKKVRMSKCG